MQSRTHGRLITRRSYGLSHEHASCAWMRRTGVRVPHRTLLSVTTEVTHRRPAQCWPLNPSSMRGETAEATDQRQLDAPHDEFGFDDHPNTGQGNSWRARRAWRALS